MAAYRKAVTEDKQYCTEFLTPLDATAERGVFTDTPWIPGELKEVVNAVLGCNTYPEHPEDMFRPPPTSTSGENPTAVSDRQVSGEVKPRSNMPRRNHTSSGDRVSSRSAQKPHSYGVS
jgi:hypothetical protein